MLVVGPTGEAKQRLCLGLASKLGGNVLTTAALLEAASAGDAAEARQLRELQSRGKIVPNAKLLELALGAVRGSSGPHVLCEFPRAMDQLTQLEAAAGEVACVVQMAADTIGGRELTLT